MLSILILGITLSIDSVFVGITYGIKGTKIPFSSFLIILIFSVFYAAISVLGGGCLKNFLGLRSMVGHTGVMAAAVKAVETVDTCVGEVEKAVLRMGGILIVTADHGNADCMRAADGSPHTAHTTNPVPFILVGAGERKLRPGRLADIAPTMLELMDLAKPKEMTGKSLIIH